MRDFEIRSKAKSRIRKAKESARPGKLMVNC